jgi:hypothetical protein
MRLLADVCNVVVVLLGGEGGDGTVARGAAMLGRFAAEVKDGMGEKEAGELLWNIMVGSTRDLCAGRLEMHVICILL